MLFRSLADEMTSLSSTMPGMAEADRIAEFKEVAELMPDDPVVRFGLAGAYLDAGAARERGRRVPGGDPAEAGLLGGAPGATDRHRAAIPQVEKAEDYYRQALALAEELGMRPLVAHCHLASASSMGARVSPSRRVSSSPRRWRCTARWTCASGWSRRRRR